MKIVTLQNGQKSCKDVFTLFSASFIPRIDGNFPRKITLRHTKIRNQEPMTAYLHISKKFFLVYS